ncbi:DUF1829 domain-containing protein [Methanocella conradii]|uniref:DUF1829 domain-containing protein n=1 Tax=Methanocella conradii TaxID=1175444 RepID=UPI0024B39EC9|nr:DUF1829 domain-containing protein [Methanocella conradii]MDI6896815.1 DUF1829 domain-containing protein [Methanocella conradii]
MSTSSEDLINDYVDWLRREIGSRTVNDYVEITTPFLDRHNDRLQIYVVGEGDNLILTDDGYIISDLKSSGLELTTPKRRQAVDSILNGFGARLDDDKIIIEANRANFAKKKHDMIQAMLAVNDLYVMSQPMVESIFVEDVEAYLKEHEIRFTPKIKFVGKSGFDQTFDFVIPASRTRPERIIKAINSPDKKTITPIIFAWVDIKDVRPADSTAYVFLNDRDQEVSEDVMSAFENYGMRPVRWNEREKVAVELMD